MYTKQKKLIRILFISSGLGCGGAEQMLYKLIKKIDRQVFDIFVVSLGSESIISQSIKILKIPVINLKIKKNPILVCLKFIYLLFLIKKISPDIVQTWMYHADLFGGICAKISNVKNILWGIRNGNLTNERQNRELILITKILSKLSFIIPSKIISCSKKACDIHEKYGYCKDKLCYIPNGFDLKVFKPQKKSKNSIRKSLGLKTNNKVVGFVGRSHPQKNLPGFLRAAKRVIKKAPKVHFIIVGSGNKKADYFTNTEKELEKIHLFDYQGNIANIMNSFDLFVSFSSYGEGFPNVIGEAMACAVPCISTDVGDASEIIGKTGVIIPPKNERMLSKEIIRLLSFRKPVLAALGKKARQRIKTNFAINKIVQQYEAFYLSVFSESPQKD